MTVTKTISTVSYDAVDPLRKRAVLWNLTHIYQVDVLMTDRNFQIGNVILAICG